MDDRCMMMIGGGNAGGGGDGVREIVVCICWGWYLEEGLS